MSSTSGGMIHYGDEEIMRLKQKEAERYERLQRTGTMPPRAEYYTEPQLNRKERRKQAALSKSNVDQPKEKL